MIDAVTTIAQQAIEARLGRSGPSELIGVTQDPDVAGAVVLHVDFEDNAVACTTALTAQGFRCEGMPDVPRTYGVRVRVLPGRPVAAVPAGGTDRERVIATLRTVASGHDTTRIWGRLEDADPDEGLDGNAWSADVGDIADLVLAALARTTTPAAAAPGEPEPEPEHGYEMSDAEADQAQEIDRHRTKLFARLGAAWTETVRATAAFDALAGPLYDVEYAESTSAETLRHQLAVARHALVAAQAVNPCGATGDLK